MCLIYVQPIYIYFAVSGLKKGEKYFFRVAAKNEAGRGEPAETSRPVLVKPKYGTSNC